MYFLPRFPTPYLLPARPPQSELASHDGAARQQARSARDRSLRELQQSHEKQAALQQLHVDRLTQQAAQAQEAARRVQEEAARQEQERRRQKAEAEERAKQEAAVAAAAAEAARKAEAAAAAAATAARPTEAAASAAAPSAGPAAAAVSTSAAGVRDPHEAASIIAPGARELEQRCAAKLREAKALVAPLQGDEWKKMRRDLEKKINVHLQQVAGTQEQVRRKSADVAAMLRDCPAETWRTYAMLVFAGKLMKQCESQVSLQTKSAYPLAAVVVRVSHHFPQLMDLVLATLHDACPLTLPKMYSRKALQPGAYFRLMRYREVESDEGGGGGSGPAKRVVESDDAYIERMAGYVALYAAITQVRRPPRRQQLPACPLLLLWSFSGSLGSLDC